MVSKSREWEEIPLLSLSLFLFHEHGKKSTKALSTGSFHPRRISEEEINASFFRPGGTFPTIDIEGKIFSQ